MHACSCCLPGCFLLTGWDNGREDRERSSISFVQAAAYGATMFGKSLLNQFSRADFSQYNHSESSDLQEFEQGRQL
jgi:hypothetical protein